MKTIVPWVFVTGEIHILKWDMNQAFWGHSGCGHARWAFLPPTPVYREELDQDLWIPTGPSLPLEKEEGWAWKVSWEEKQTAWPRPSQACTEGAIQAAHPAWQWTWTRKHSSALCWSRWLYPGVWVWFRVYQPALWLKISPMFSRPILPVIRVMFWSPSIWIMHLFFH